MTQKVKAVVALDLEVNPRAQGHGLLRLQASSPRASSYGEEVAIIATPQTISAKIAKSSLHSKRSTMASSLMVIKKLAKSLVRNSAITKRRKAMAKDRVQ